MTSRERIRTVFVVDDEEMPRIVVRRALGTRGIEGIQLVGAVHADVGDAGG